MKRRDEVLVGLLTLIAIGALIAGVLWLARGGLTRGYPLYAQFGWGAGLRQGQPVLFSGVNVGYVDEVDLRENGTLVVMMRVYHERRIPVGTVASIAPNGLFGDMLVALRADTVDTERFYSAGDTLPATRATGQLTDVVATVDTIARGLNALLREINTELVDNRILRTVRLTVESADSLFGSIERIARQQSAELTRTQEALRRVASSVDSARIAAVMDTIGAAAANANALLADFRQTNTRLNDLLAKVDSGDGSLARLINSGDFERDMRGVLVRLDSLMADFKANPRKYIKLSIF